MNEAPRRRTVVLTITHKCNLNCSYCYEQHGTATMDFSKLVGIIRTELSDSIDCDEIEFDFFGGEPFLEFETMRKVVELIESEHWCTPYCFFATTNGTLVHGHIQDWLRDHPNFYCGLSFDGTCEMQDINRSNSSKRIDLDFFRRQYPNQEIKMTVSPTTLQSLFDGVVFLEEKGFQVSCNLAYGLDWSDTNNVQVIEFQLERLIVRYLANPEQKPCRMLEPNIDNLVVGLDKPRRYCGAGRGMVAYDVDSKTYPCQLFMPISCGEEKASQVCDIQFPELEIEKNCLDPKCEHCVAKNVCPTCFGANYIEFGNIYLHSDGYCTLIKTITRAKSFLRAKQWEAGQIQMSEEKEKTMLKSILLIQQNL